MRTYLYVSLLLLLAACQEDDLVSYEQDMDSIQFDFGVEDMKYDYNFAMQNVYDKENYYYYFFGDSLRMDTLTLYVSLMGHKSDVDRFFRLKTVPIEGQQLATVEFLPDYRVKANQLKDTIQVIMHRPEARGHYSVGLTFDLEGGDASFITGVEERAVFRLNISDRYEKPTEWDRLIECTGEYTEEKYAFMLSVLHSEWDFYSNWTYLNQVLREELAAFNEQHPDNPKDFTFPVYSKPYWWDQVLFYLGTYSEEKKEFMDEVLPPGYSRWSPWDEYNQLLQDKLQVYNNEHPDAPLDFSFPIIPKSK